MARMWKLDIFKKITISHNYYFNDLYLYIRVTINKQFPIIDQSLLLTLFSKVIETIMYNTIVKFLETKGTIHDCQFGFRTNHSTQHAIITLVDKITKLLIQEIL